MLKIDLKGKVAFVAGIGDDQGYGWAIAKSLAEAGATILVGTWPPMLKILDMSMKSGKFDESRRLSDGSLMEFAKIYPLDVSYDSPEDVPEEVSKNKRYVELEQGYTISDVAAAIGNDFGKIDIFVHAIANAPEVSKPLLGTSRQGYLSAINASTYSLISLLAHIGPYMHTGSAVLSLSYMASERAIPGYGGGMSSAKAALESDTRTLAWEAGRKWGVRVMTISAGVLASRAARAIPFTSQMLDYVATNAPLVKELKATEIGATAAFLVSPLASAITGVTIYVDNGMHAMGVARDSPAFG